MHNKPLGLILLSEKCMTITSKQQFLAPTNIPFEHWIDHDKELSIRKYTLQKLYHSWEQS